MPSTTYSKPLGDIAALTSRLTADNRALLDEQRRQRPRLAEGTPRTACTVCAAALDRASIFIHRDVPYRVCLACTHVQTQYRPPAGYPFASGQTFSAIYPPLDPAAFAERTARIYAPKLDWVLRCLGEAGLPRRAVLERSWVELGCGGGYFLKALQDAGGRSVLGLEADAGLAARAAEVLGSGTVRFFDGSAAAAIRAFPAEVYAAWFVLEHVEELTALWAALREQPPGTLLLCAVPVFGLATLIEAAGACHYARHLDGVYHTQMFSEASLQAGLDQAGFQVLGEWIFGQDAVDLFRFLMVSLSATVPPALLTPLVPRIESLLDGLQERIDQARLADARHIVAVRRQDSADAPGNRQGTSAGSHRP